MVVVQSCCFGLLHTSGKGLKYGTVHCTDASNRYCFYTVYYVREKQRSQNFGQCAMVHSRNLIVILVNEPETHGQHK